METVSIKVNIAGRLYPLSVGESEVADLRQAETALEESIQLFQKNYAVKDKQDLLAMTALQFSAKAHKLSHQPKPEPIVEKVIERVEVPVEVRVDCSRELLDLEARLDQLLHS
jgi:cell division protein ZapA (FtsZ GTPase activity inhibitor)